MFILSDPNVYEDVQLLMPLFTGWFDSPKWGVIDGLDSIEFSGWLIPRAQARYYELEIQYPDGGNIRVTPNLPRPDVAKLYTALPLGKAKEFCGFYAKLPVAEELLVSVVFEDGETVFWTKVQCRKVDKDFQKIIPELLTRGYDHQESLTKRFTEMSLDTRLLCIDYYFFHLKTLEVENVLASFDDSRLHRLLKIMHAPDFFAHLMECYAKHGEILLPGPFYEGQAKLILSFFQEDLENIRQHVNYLVFESSQERFYVEQHMHSVDCLFCPAQNLLVRFPYSGQFSRKKLKRFLRDVLILGEGDQQINTTPSKSEFGGVIMNSLSPHHFFYDFLPALDIAYEKDLIQFIPKIIGLEGMSYYPLDIMYDLPIKNIQMDWNQMKTLSSRGDQYFITTGVSHKMVPIEKTKDMDRRLVEKASGYSHRKKVIDISEAIRNRFPVFLLGISAYGRSWLNQESFLQGFLNQLYIRYPHCAFVFDGVTSHTYEYQDEQELFRKDAKIVET